MRRELVLLSLVSVLALSSVVQAANIIWVSDNKGFGSVEPNVAADQGWIDLLTAQGHNVVYKNQNEYIDGQQYWRTLDPNKIAELEAADLVILSRNADSGSYSTYSTTTGANEPNQWNAVTTPLISLSAHMSRIGGKWGWLNGTGTTKAKEGLLKVVDPNHPVFAGVAIDPNGRVQALNAQWNIDWVTGVKDAGNGKVLATRASDDLVSIVTWEAGQKFFEAGTKVAGGPRMLFVAGTGTSNAAPNYAPDGMYNLTPDGEKMFVNAVNFMINKGKQIIWVADNLHYGSVEPNKPADQGFIDLLTAQGYEVIYKDQHNPVDGQQYWRALDPNKIAELEAADLIIIARDCASSAYDDANEAQMWNAVTTPLIMQGPHIARTLPKWGWFNSGNTVANSVVPMKVLDPNHPIFKGVTLDPNNQVAVLTPPIKSDLVKGAVDAGNGKVLATRSDNGLVWIATWETGQEFFAGSTQIAGGPRMFFGSGAGGNSNNPVDGVYNLTAEGEKMFLNAVDFMMAPLPLKPGE